MAMALADSSRAFKEAPRVLGGDIVADLEKSMGKLGGIPGVETPAASDGPDVLDGGDGVDGLGVNWVASGSSSCQWV
jgi:hypothetical protein